MFYEKYTRFTTFEWVCLPIALACTCVCVVMCRHVSWLVVTRRLYVWCAVIIFGIYLLSKHGEDDFDTTGSICSDSHIASSRAHLTSGHFGALMPLSPSHRTASMLSSQQSKHFDDRDEQTPLRSNGNGKLYEPSTAASPRPNTSGLPAAVALATGKQSAESPRAYQRIVV